MVILEPKTTSANSRSFKSKVKIAESASVDFNTKDVVIVVTLIYLSNVCRFLEILIINSKINHILIWYANCRISAANEWTELEITYTKLYFLITGVPPKDNAKLLAKIKPGLRITITWK